MFIGIVCRLKIVEGAYQVKMIAVITFNLTFLIFTGVIGYVYLMKPNGYSELISHFALFFFMISSIYFSLYVFYNNKIFIALSLTTLIVTAYQWMPLLLPASEPKNINQGDEVSILQLNIWCHMDDVKEVLNYIEEKEYPDIVVIQEATPELADKLRSLKDKYTYTFDASEHGAFGMLLYSRIPFLMYKERN
jgi:endonuclease/exonuclease/phosphatase (EEP) superfamily protein YafD